MCKILWLDNDADILEPYAEMLAEYDIFADLISDANEALEIISAPDHPYECILLDLRFYRISEMPEGDHAIRSGFDFIERMIDRDVKIAVCILSSYLQIDEYAARLEEYSKEKSIRGIAIDKYVDDTTSDVFQIKFIDKIRNFVEEVESDKTKPGIRRPRHSDLLRKDPFRISYANYLKLSKDEQRKIRRKARSRAEKALDDLRAKNAIWALFIGSQTKPYAFADSYEQIWGKERIADIADEKSRVPFQFRINSTIEDAWGHCGSSIENASYPKVALTKKDSRPEAVKPEAQWFAHFDTGTFESYFSLEELMDIGLFRDYVDLIDDEYRGIDYSYRSEEVGFVIRDDITGETTHVNAEINLVEGWDKSPFLAQCTRGCLKGRPMRNGFRNCINRCGLIGRSLLIKDDLQVLFTPKEPILRVSKRGTD